MNRRAVVAVALSVMLVLQLSGNAQASAGEINWVGCGIVKGAFMNAIAKAYEKKTGVAIKLSGGGATLGVRAPSAGSADMGGTCRDALLTATGEVVGQERDAVLNQVAWDAIVAITHPGNPVQDLTLRDLKKIYAGEITNWSAVGGPDARIVLVTREGTTSGVGHTFRLLAFGDGAHEFKARSFKVKATGALEEKIEATPFSLGVDGVSSARKRKVKVLSLDGVGATKENVAAARYPLFRPLYIAVNAKAGSEVRAAMDFMLGPEGQAIISQEGTVNLSEGKGLEPLWEQKSRQFRR